MPGKQVYAFDGTQHGTVHEIEGARLILAQPEGSIIEPITIFGNQPPRPRFRTRLDFLRNLHRDVFVHPFRCHRRRNRLRKFHSAFKIMGRGFLDASPTKHQEPQPRWNSGEFRGAKSDNSIALLLNLQDNKFSGKQNARTL